MTNQTSFSHPPTQDTFFKNTLDTRDDLLNRLIFHLHAELRHDHAYHADCPFCHKEAKPGQTHFNFSERGYYCFVCGEGGSLWSLAQHLNILDQPAESHPKRRPRPQRALQPPRVVPTPNCITQADVYLQRYTQHPAKYRLWQDYMPALTRETIDTYQLGVGYLEHEQGQTNKLRLIVPIFKDSQIVSWRGRLIDPQASGPKWATAAGTHKQLFNLDRLVPEAIVVINANNVDSIALMQLVPTVDSIPVVALSPTTGETSWDVVWTESIVASRPRAVVIIYDHDRTGERQAAKRIADFAALGITAYPFQWDASTPAKYDLGDLLKTGRVQEVEAFIRTALANPVTITHTANICQITGNCQWVSDLLPAAMPLPKIMTLKSPQGTGKTTALGSLLQRFEAEHQRPARVIYLTHRNALNRNLQTRLNKLCLQRYLTMRGKKIKVRRQLKNAPIVQGRLKPFPAYKVNHACRMKRVKEYLDFKSRVQTQLAPFTFVSHMDIPGAEMAEISNLITSYESLAKLRHPDTGVLPAYDFVMLDESEQSFKHVVTSTTFKATESQDVVNILCGLLGKASHGILLDANLGILSQAFLEILEWHDVTQWHVVNTYERIDLPPAHFYTTRAQLVTRIAAVAKAGHTIGIVTDKKLEAENWAKFLAGADYGYDAFWVNSENSPDAQIQAQIAEINEQVRQRRVIIFSPSITSGVDITAPVDYVFGDFRGDDLTCEELGQMVGRFRQVTHAVEIYIPHIITDIHNPLDFIEFKGNQIVLPVGGAELAAAHREKLDIDFDATKILQEQEDLYRRAIQSRLGILVEYDPQGNPIEFKATRRHMQLWAVSEAKDNRLLARRRDALMQRLNEEGYTVQLIPQDETSNAEEDRIALDQLQETRTALKEEKRAFMRTCEPLSEEDYRALVVSGQATQQDTLRRQVAEMIQAYGRSPQDPTNDWLFDEWGIIHGGEINRYHHLLLDNRTLRKLDIDELLTRDNDMSYKSFVLQQKRVAQKTLVLELLGALFGKTESFILTPEAALQNRFTSADLDKFMKKVGKESRLIKNVLYVDPGKYRKPIKLLRAILATVGLKLQCERPKTKKEAWVYWICPERLRIMAEHTVHKFNEDAALCYPKIPRCYAPTVSKNAKKTLSSTSEEMPISSHSNTV